MNLTFTVVFHFISAIASSVVEQEKYLKDVVRTLQRVCLFLTYFFDITRQVFCLIFALSMWNLFQSKIFFYKLSKDLFETWSIQI